jgi:hypothetical protein
MVRAPLSCREIERRVQRRLYESFEQFVADISRACSGAMSYYEYRSPPYRKAYKLAALLRRCEEQTQTLAQLRDDPTVPVAHKYSLLLPAGMQLVADVKKERRRGDGRGADGEPAGVRRRWGVEADADPGPEAWTPRAPAAAFARPHWDMPNGVCECAMCSQRYTVAYLGGEVALPMPLPDDEQPPLPPGVTEDDAPWRHYTWVCPRCVHGPEGSRAFVGRRVYTFSHTEFAWSGGVIDAMEPSTGRHRVTYDDGRWEFVDLAVVYTRYTTQPPAAYPSGLRVGAQPPPRPPPSAHSTVADSAASGAGAGRGRGRGGWRRGRARKFAALPRALSSAHAGVCVPALQAGGARGRAADDGDEDDDHSAPGPSESDTGASDSEDGAAGADGGRSAKRQRPNDGVDAPAP